jgi:hypothetical protein
MLRVPNPQHSGRFVVPGIAEFGLLGKAISVIDDSENAMNWRNGASSHVWIS